MDSFEIESRELFDKSRMSRIEVLVVVKSVVQSAVGSCSAMSSCRCRGKHCDVFFSGFGFGCILNIVCSLLL